jgi:hypothetical protein
MKKATFLIGGGLICISMYVLYDRMEARTGANPV